MMPSPSLVMLIQCKIREVRSVGIPSINLLLVEAVLMVILSISLVVMARSESHSVEAAHCPDWLWRTECVVSQCHCRLQEESANTLTAS